MAATYVDTEENIRSRMTARILAAYDLLPPLMQQDLAEDFFGGFNSDSLNQLSFDNLTSLHQALALTLHVVKRDSLPVVTRESVDDAYEKIDTEVTDLVIDGRFPAGMPALKRVLEEYGQ